jgi:hypothetical protein
VALSVDTRSTGRSFQVMAQSAIDKIAPGPKLDALRAEKVFGWKNLHKHQGALVGKRQKYGKLGEPRRVGIQEVEGGFMPVASIKSVGLKRSKSTS